MTDETPKNPVPTHHWPQQSPIELLAERSYHVRTTDRFESDYREAPYAGLFRGEPGHRNFELTDPYPGEHPPMARLGNIDARLIKIHLHTPPEHDLERDDTGGEIHLIHRIVAPTSGSTLLVVGVFFREHADAPPMGAFVDSWKRGCASEVEAASIDPRTLLPRDTTKWYRYEGSLTSKPYDEIVSWLIFTEPLRITSEDLRALEREAAQPERAVQPLDRRFVLRNFE